MKYKKMSLVIVFIKLCEQTAVLCVIATRILLFYRHKSGLIRFPKIVVTVSSDHGNYSLKCAFPHRKFPTGGGEVAEEDARYVICNQNSRQCTSSSLWCVFKADLQ